MDQSNCDDNQDITDEDEGLPESEEEHSQDMQEDNGSTMIISKKTDMLLN